MKDFLNETNQKKHQFKSYYCAGCRQRKVCGLLHPIFCCPCQFQMQQERAEEYKDYQQVYQRKLREREAHIQQYQLLKSYQGCKQCGSKEVDAYHLYNENKLVCQPCLMRKEGHSSSPISFLEQQK